MAVLAAIAAAAVIGFVLRHRKWRWWVAWFVSCAIVPGFVLFAEFVLPYQGGGASMWRIAIFFGGIYGAIAGGIGVIFAAQLEKHRAKDT